MIFKGGKQKIDEILYNTDTSSLLKEHIKIAFGETSGYSLFCGRRGNSRGKFFICEWEHRNNISCEVVNIIPIDRNDISKYEWNTDYSPALQ